MSSTWTPDGAERTPSRRRSVGLVSNRPSRPLIASKKCGLVKSKTKLCAFGSECERVLGRHRSWDLLGYVRLLSLAIVSFTTSIAVG